MEKPAYTLSWILPFVRQALKTTSNFEYRTYANAILFQLEKAQVEGVVRFQLGAYSGGQLFQYDQVPLGVREVIAEAYFHLFHKGYITPNPPDSTLNPPHFQ